MNSWLALFAIAWLVVTPIRSVTAQMVAGGSPAPSSAQSDTGHAVPFESPKVDVDKDHDEMTGVTTWTTWLDGKGYFGLPAPLRLGLRKVISENDSTPEYVLVVQYRAPDWAFIGPGQSCLWLIDGKRVALSGEGSHEHRRVYDDGTDVLVEEFAYYPVTEDFLRQLGTAHQARVRVVGQKRESEKELKDKQFDKVRGFLAAMTGPKGT
jgi:hypothetical protein